MLKIENYEVLGWEHAIRGMRNPMNSWEQSDSCDCGDIDNCEECFGKDRCRHYAGETYDSSGLPIVVGEKDWKLMMNLRKAGTDHRKFMRMLTVYVDITAPFYWWKEFDTYKVGTVANSCSTMHKVHAKEFVPEDFSVDIPDEDIKDFLSQKQLRVCVETMAGACEAIRKSYLYYNELSKRLEYTESERKHFARVAKYWWKLLIQYMPISYNQKRTVMLNYEVLANMYKSRRHHKLDEWHVLCDWIEKLPYAELITGEDNATEANV